MLLSRNFCQLCLKSRVLRSLLKKLSGQGVHYPGQGLMEPVLTEKFEGVGTSIRAEGFGVGGGEKGLVVGCNFFWIPMQLGLDVGGRGG